jgi:hypothetical protein
MVVEAVADDSVVGGASTDLDWKDVSRECWLEDRTLTFSPGIIPGCTSLMPCAE